MGKSQAFEREGTDVSKLHMKHLRANAPYSNHRLRNEYAWKYFKQERDMVGLPFCSSNMANDIDTERERCFINDRKYILTYVSNHIYQLVYVLACIYTSLLYSNACTSIVNTSFMAVNEPHNQVSVSIMSHCAVSRLLNQFATMSA